MKLKRMKNACLLIAIATLSLSLLATNAAAQTRLRGVMVSPDPQAADLNTLGQWKANLIRWQLTLNNEAARDAAYYDQWLNAKLGQIDALLPVCRQNGLKVIIDVHTPPGGYDQTSNEHRIFRESRYSAQLKNIWERIAQRYRNNATIWGYDLVNEPHVNDVAKWQSLAQDLATRIRRIESTRRIIVESRYGHPGRIDELRPLSGIANVVYSVHMYWPLQFTHQGTRASYPRGIAYPGRIGGTTLNKAALENQLGDVVSFQRRHRVPIYIGEFSAARWAPGESAYNYIRDLISIFEDNGWDWTYHAFREADVWSVEHGPDPNNPNPSPTPTSRLLLLQRNFARN